MAISGRLLDLPSTRTFWCIAYVICLTICASAFPVKKSEDYDGLYEFGGDGAHNLVLKEEERRASAPLWFHRAGKASLHSAPMWFNRMSRSGEYNPEGISLLSLLNFIINAIFLKDQVIRMSEVLDKLHTLGTTRNWKILVVQVV